MNMKKEKNEIVGAAGLIFCIVFSFFEEGFVLKVNLKVDNKLLNFL